VARSSSCPPGANAAWLGVADTDATSGQKVGVTSGGVQELIASGAIAAGDVLISAAAGKVAAIGGGTTYSQVVGIALTAAADAAKVRVRMVR
jgi:predicted RecA/RadA family phage recombinase